MDRREALIVLRLPPSADAAAIKQAYRQQVRDLHPDVGGDVAAFQELQRAYETLADHAPAQAPPVRRGRPSRERTAWETARDGHRPTVDVDAVAWDAPLPADAGPLDRTSLTVRLAALPAPDAGPVRPTAATSRAPGSRLNRFAASLSPDMTSQLRIRARRDDRGRTVVATDLTASGRKARRAVDRVALDGPWMRTRGSSVTTLTATTTPDADARATALRVVEPLTELLERLAWPLESWVLDEAPH